MTKYSYPPIRPDLLRVMSAGALRIYLRTLRRSLEAPDLTDPEVQEFRTHVYLVERQLKEVNDD